MNQQRNASFDLLKIISMFMVVVLHAFGNGKALAMSTTGSLNWLLGNIINGFCIVAVNCFALISGYYLCTAPFKLKKLARLWLMSVFWSIVLYLLSAFVLHTDTFSLNGIVKSVLVFTWKPWWYLTQYILLYLCTPFINSAIHSMTKGKHFSCCVVAITIFSILPTITIFGSDFSGIGTGFSFIWLICLYLVASYIRLYIVQPSSVEWRWLTVYVLFSLIVAGESLIRHVVVIPGNMNLFYAYNSTVCFGSSLGLFMFIRSCHISSRLVYKTIEFVSPLTFAVFLIHHFPQNKELLWETIHLYSYGDSPLLILYVIGFSILIFSICIMAEYLRVLLFKLIRINSFVDVVCDRIQRKYTLIINRDIDRI